MRAAETDRAQTVTSGLRWWREALYMLAFYGVYTAVRDTQGSAGRGQAAPSTTALRHAHDIIQLERDVWLFHEHQVQHYFLTHLAGWTPRFFQFWDLWYGTTHFAVTAAVVVWLFVRRPDRYPFWRNTLAITTALALVGFAAFPLMPPRLLPHAGYGFVDTLARYGGSWSFDKGAMTKVSNQFAAMPSLHIGWSTWCACALYPAARSRWAKAAVIGYPLVTLFCIVVTANHYFLDAVAGVVTLGLAVLLARPLTALTRK